MFNILFALSEKTQSVIRVILVIALIIVLLLAIFGGIGYLVEKIMERQSKTLDALMGEIVFSRLVDKPEKFSKIAHKKSRIHFFKSATIPILLCIASLLIWTIYHLIDNNWSESIFDTNTGILSLIYIYKFTFNSTTDTLGIYNLGINVETLNTPHIVQGSAITNYFVFIFGIVGIIWYLICVQAFFARWYRIVYLKKKMFSTDLEKVDLSHFYNSKKINPYGDEIKKAQVEESAQASNNENVDKKPEN